MESQRASRPVVELPPWAQISAKRCQHVQRVADVILAWADELRVPAVELQRWLKAVSLHDALKDAPDDLLAGLAPDAWGVAALRHGPAAAARAEQDGETDRGVLDAVRYHSVGYVGWDATGTMLYLADYLEPGRSYHTEVHDQLRARVPGDVGGVLRQVAAERVSRTLAAGRPILQETMDFWNALVRGS